MTKPKKKLKRDKDITRCFGLLTGEDLSEVCKIMEEVRRAPLRTKPRRGKGK